MDELRQNEIDSDRTGRRLPLRVNYHGFPLYARLEYADKGQERRIAKVVVSYREQIAEPQKRRKKQYGKAVLERKYSPVGEGTREEVIQSTIEAVVPTAFLPELFHVAPELMTGELACAVVLPTALIRLEAMQTVTAETTAKRRKAMDALLKLWGDLPVKDLTPERCAPGILSMGTAMATNCISLLRALFAGFLTQIVDDPHIWERYRVTGRKTRTSLEATERRNLLPPVLTEDQCRQMMLRCMDGCKTRYADRYIAASLMLVTGVSVDEVCALDLQAVRQAEDYPSVWYVDIDQSLQPSMSGKKYSIRPIQDKYRHRRIVLGRWIMGLLRPLIDEGRTLLLHNPSNPARTLSPKIMGKWIDDTFGDIITNNAVYNPRGEVETRKTIRDYCRYTALYYLEWYGGLREEELRRLEGRAPQHTDAAYYADLECESELLRMTSAQNTWASRIIGAQAGNRRELARPRTRKQYIAVAADDRHPHMHITITGLIKEPIVVKLDAEFGARIHVKSMENKGETA